MRLGSFVAGALAGAVITFVFGEAALIALWMVVNVAVLGIAILATAGRFHR